MDSRRIKKVAFQGEAGAYSAIAACKFFKSNIQLIPNESFDLVFRSVEKNSAEFGVIPIENSLAGSIHQNYDLLLKHDLLIVGESKLRIVHHLIANPGVKLSNINKIFSHPQALMQCQSNIETLGKKSVIPTYDTAGSVKKIKEERIMDGAAIASDLAAEIYEMNILRNELQDSSANYTRFLLLSKKEQEKTNPDKTSIVFSIKDSPGALFRAISVFALRDIDLYKIESRPLHSKPWEYFFYIDFASSLTDSKCSQAISQLKGITSYLKILGSYKRDFNKTSKSE